MASTKKKLSSRTAARLGRKGGLVKVPKGLATMAPGRAREIQSAGGKARWPNR
jgi:hypothetical protein